MIETALIIAALVAMLIVLIISIVPYVPGPILMWLVMLAFGLANEFERLPLLALAIVTVLMVIGATVDLWMPIIGIRTQGASCWGTLGTLIGGIIGTFVIPIPILGTVLGSVIGALLFEFIRAGEVKLALKSGAFAIKLFIYGLIAEYTISIIMLIVFLLSLWFTR